MKFQFSMKKASLEQGLTIWWNNTTHFGMRSSQEHIDMRWGDVELKITSTGEEYLEYSERITKTRNGVSRDQRPFSPKMFEVKGNSRCPVHTYKEYIRRRPSELNDDPNSAFYLAVNPNIDLNVPTSKWFIRQNMGKNKIGNLMTNMCQNAGIQGRKTNHSARRTTVSTLLHNGVAPTTVMQVTGHKNVHSINHYGSASVAQQKEMSNTLSALQTTTASNTLREEFNDEDDQSMINASQEVEEALQNIDNFEALMSNFDIDIPSDTTVVPVITNTTPVTAPSAVPVTANVSLAIPNSSYPTLIDIPIPNNMKPSSESSWFSNANIGSGVTINFYGEEPATKKRCFKCVRLIESDTYSD